MVGHYDDNQSRANSNIRFARPLSHDYRIKMAVEVCFCRICHASGANSPYLSLEGKHEPDHQHEPAVSDFLSPCKCTGSLKHVHKSCLNAWRLIASGSNYFQCELCHESYQFSDSTVASLINSKIFLRLLTVIFCGLWMGTGIMMTSNVDSFRFFLNSIDRAVYNDKTILGSTLRDLNTTRTKVLGGCVMVATFTACLEFVLLKPSPQYIFALLLTIWLRNFIESRILLVVQTLLAVFGTIKAFQCFHQHFRQTIDRIVKTKFLNIQNMEHKGPENK